MFMEQFMTVAGQVAVLFLLIGIGFACQRAKILNEAANRGVSDFVMYIVTPSVIITSLERSYDPALMRDYAVMFAACMGMHLVMILLSVLLMRDASDDRERVLRFAAVFSNSGFMALPLEQALLGDIGAFFGSAYIAVFNIYSWTWGVRLMARDRVRLSLRQIVINPGIIGIAAGMVLFLTSWRLPSALDRTLGHLAALNLPLPMVLVGWNLGRADLRRALRDVKAFACIAVRLLLMPAVCTSLLWLCGLRGTLLTVCAISVCAPVGAVTTIFATKFGRDTELSVSLVSLSTLLSMVTMPLIIALVQTIA